MSFCLAGELKTLSRYTSSRENECKLKKDVNYECNNNYKFGCLDLAILLCLFFVVNVFVFVMPTGIETAEWRQ